MGLRERITLALVLAVGACGGDDDGPMGPVGDDLTPEQGVAMCTPLGADAAWSFARLGAGTKPALAVGADGSAHVAIINEALDGWVRYARLPAGANSPSELATASSGYFYGPIDVLLGPDGEPRILYHDHDLEDQVLATRLPTGQWQTNPMANPGHDGWYNAGVFDESGILHTASYDPRGFGGRGVNYGAWDGSAWSIELASPGSFDYAGGMAIAESGAGIEVLFFDDLAGVAKLASRTGLDAWSTSTVEPLGGFVEVGRFPDVAKDPLSGELHLVYLALTGGGSGTIRYANGMPGALEIRDVADVDDFTIGFSGARDLATLALDSQGVPLVAIQTRSELTVSRVEAASVETVASFGAQPGVTFGQQTEIVIDVQGRTHVVWWQSGEAPGTVCHAAGS